MELAATKIQKMISDTSGVRVKRKEWVYEGRWLRAGCIHYSSQTGQERTWETVERTTTVGGIDGVDVIALSENSKAIHLVAVYRPSVNSVSIEIPGGLIDKGETIQQACLRELGEETCLSGYVESADFVNHCDPWKSNESYVACVVKTNVDQKCDSSLKPDEDEYIETFELPLNNLLSSLWELKRAFDDKIVIESKLYMLAKGLQLGQMFEKTR